MGVQYNKKKIPFLERQTGLCELLMESIKAKKGQNRKTPQKNIKYTIF